MKILVVLTGGTIGSLTTDSVIAVDDSSPYLLINQYEQRYGTSIDFQVLQPLHTLSENILPSHWDTLYGCLKQTDFSVYDGIIITHGSDTLAYTSSLFSMIFSNIPIPMVFIAANYPLEDTRSNGSANFKSAIDFIKTVSFGGVFTIYQNDKKENMVYLPTRLLPSDSYNDQFGLFGSTAFGMVQDDHFMSTSNIVLSKTHSFEFDLSNGFCANVLKLMPYPGIAYNQLDFSGTRPAAIFHQLYHAGTCCMNETDSTYNMEDFCQRCAQEEIPLFVGSMKHPYGNVYESTHRLLKQGVHVLYNISHVSAYTKLVLAYSQVDCNPLEIMKTNLYYEILPEPDL